MENGLIGRIRMTPCNNQLIAGVHFREFKGVSVAGVNEPRSDRTRRMTDVTNTQVSVEKNVVQESLKDLEEGQSISKKNNSRNQEKRLYVLSVVCGFILLMIGLSPLISNSCKQEASDKYSNDVSSDSSEQFENSVANSQASSIEELLAKLRAENPALDAIKGELEDHLPSFGNCY